MAENMNKRVELLFNDNKSRIYELKIELESI